jgi:5-methyltetrahydrofolate--homocysteine methyltransferase
MPRDFTALFRSGEPVVLDGGMGTMLMAAGLLFGDPPELWNVDPVKRALVAAVHRGYVEAGAQVILTNSFGGSPFRLKLHNLQDRTFELNKAAAELARAEAGERAFVAGSVGPSGELFEPMGGLTYAAAVEGFAAQAAGLAAGGVDAFWVETMSDLQEVRAAVAGCRRAAPALPVVATMTFDTRGFTMMGVSPEEAANALAELDLAALGGNCGNGPDEIEAVIFAMHRARPDLPLVAKSNAGMPQVVGDRTVYGGTPEVMAECARRLRAFGATGIGACCGSTPAHIAAMAAALRDAPPLDPAALTLAAPLAERKEPSRRRGRRGAEEAAVTSTYQILYWHDIPLQVRARCEGGRASAALPPRFQEAVDSAAMAAGLIGSDAYTEAMRWGEQAERPGSPQAVAAAVAAELDAAHPAVDWRATVRKIKG